MLSYRVTLDLPPQLALFVSRLLAEHCREIGTVEVLAAQAPTLRQALEEAVEGGLPYLILDGTLISSDRCAGKKPAGKAGK